MVDFEETCIEALKAASCRVTKQRLAVIRCIAKARHPLSAPEIYEKLSSRGKTAPLDKVSVYRVLDTLLELNLFNRVSPDW